MPAHYPSESLYPSGDLFPSVPGSSPVRGPQPRTPHLSFPFRMIGKTVAQVEQDSLPEIAQNVLVALGTRIGSRIDAPEYGTPSELFSQLGPEPSIGAVLVAVEELEPRATLLSEIQVEELIERVQVKVGAAG